jgi:hypothetical protein
MMQILASNGTPSARLRRSLPGTSKRPRAIRRHRREDAAQGVPRGAGRRLCRYGHAYGIDCRAATRHWQHGERRQIPATRHRAYVDVAAALLDRLVTMPGQSTGTEAIVSLSAARKTSGGGPSPRCHVLSRSSTGREANDAALTPITIYRCRLPLARL